MKRFLSLFLFLLMGVMPGLAATVPLNQAKSSDTLPNFLRNGGFWFAQRQAPGTLTTYSSTAGRAFSADGWAITNENASVQYIRTDTSGAAESGLQGQFYGNFTKITSTGKMEVSQCVEGQHTCMLRGRNVRLQFWAKQLVGTTPVLHFDVIQLNSSGTINTIPATFISAHGANSTDPTLGTNLAYIAPTTGIALDNATAIANGATCTLSASWQRFGAVFTIPTTAKNLVIMIWGNAQFAATNGFALAQVSLSDSQNIQDFAPADITQEFDKVQRYYCKTFNQDTAPAQSAGAGTGEFRFQAGVVGALGDFGWWQFPVRMWQVPGTITTYNPAAANAQVRDITAAADCSATATSVGTETGLMVTDTGNAATAVGNKLGVHITADMEL